MKRDTSKSFQRGFVNSLMFGKPIPVVVGRPESITDDEWKIFEASRENRLTPELLRLSAAIAVLSKPA